MPPARTFRGVQAMRGIAACMVVLFHATENWSIATTGTDTHAWFAGASGVDLFFIISGFVMATSSLGGANGPHAAWLFLKRRFVRIYPLYWLITALLFAKITLGLVHNHANANPIPPLYALCSFLLIPCKDAHGDVFPLLGTGWTLTFEMFFYVCFAGALWLSRSVLIALTVVLGLLSLGALLRTPAWPAATILLSPLLLEFLAGLWLGKLAQRAHPQRRPLIAAAFGAVALLALWSLPMPAGNPFTRLEWGLLALLALNATVQLEPRIGSHIPRWLLLLGDASYSIYLTHAPLMGLWTFLLKRAHVLVFGRVLWQDDAIAMAFSLLLSAIVGVLTYLAVERPLNQFVQHLAGLRRPVQTEAAKI